MSGSITGQNTSEPMKLRLHFSDGGMHPVLGRVLHRTPIAEGPDTDRYQLYLANALSSLAIDRRDCAQLLALIQDVETGAKPAAKWMGQDVEASFDSHRVQIDITVDDAWVGQPEGVFPLREFKAAVRAWDEFLQLPQAMESVVVVDLDTENVSRLVE